MTQVHGLCNSHNAFAGRGCASAATASAAEVQQLLLLLLAGWLQLQPKHLLQSL
jgi:hypothetical protein